jgi:hypothetical protein
MLLIDLAGNKYGRLTAVSRGRTKQRIKGTEVYWKCVCDCGNEHEVSGRNLRSGESQSCGCIVRGPKPTVQAAINELYSLYQTRARRKGYPFSLTKEQFKILIDGHCFYCGMSPYQICRRERTSTISYTYNGIDRVNNSSGYVADNVVSCCGICNKAKNTMSQDEFYAWIKRVHKLKLEILAPT